MRGESPALDPCLPPARLGPPCSEFSILCLQVGIAVKSVAFMAPSYSAKSGEALRGQISYVPSAGPD